MHVHLSGSNIRYVEVVTASDDADLGGVASYGPACAVYVAESGSVVVTTTEGDVTFGGLVAGMWHPMPPFTRVKEASTATGIVAGY